MGQRRTEGRRVISRREFLRLSAVAAVGTGLAACGGEAPAPVAETEPSPPPGQAETPASPAAEASPAGQATATPATVPTEFNEAPMIAEMGDLPPVTERLPSTPCVCPVMESTGNYGGTIRRGFSGVSDRVGPTKMNNEGLTWYNPDLSLRANIVESWELNDDATEWTFHLREGMKWSDGHPFDSESFMWWYENFLRNEELTTTIPDAWSTGNPPVLMEMEAPDPVTVIFRFEHPNPLFAYTVARPGEGGPFAPSHYMQQFHPDHAEDAEQRAAAAGFEDWASYYLDDRNVWYLNPERPDYGPWVAQNTLNDELFTMERNPYFWQVDADGNQLPYVDRVQHRLFNTPEVLNLRVVNGEIDFQARHMNIGNFTLYKENEAQGDYRVLNGVWANHMAFQPNHTTKNERLREFFQNRDVRIALSLAINRDEINELVLLGQATPRQYSPLSLSPQFYQPLSEAHIEYDPDRANELLDQAGYSEKDGEGFRLWNDGSGTLSFIIEGTAESGTPDEDAVQMIVRYFADVGVKATYSAAERSLYEEHQASNDIEGAFWGGDRTTLPLVAPWIFLGTISDRPWALAWGLWYNDPTNPNGQEPPEDHWIREIWSIWDQIAVEPDEERQTELFHQILDIWAEELPMIGLVGEIPQPVIVKNGLHNYVEGYPVDDTTEDEQLLNPQTLFWENPES